jgi:hypothetical protein
MKETLKPLPIPEKDKSPLVEQLLALIERQSVIIQQLKDEIARLKNQPPRPDIKPSSLGKKKKRSKGSLRRKRAGYEKRSKTAYLEIHKTKPIEPENIPVGSEFRSNRDFVVQDIVIKPLNTRFRLKVYQTPDGGYVTGKLPSYLNGKHFGATLIRLSSISITTVTLPSRYCWSSLTNLASICPQDSSTIF